MEVREFHDGDGRVGRAARRGTSSGDLRSVDRRRRQKHLDLRRGPERLQELLLLRLEALRVQIVPDLLFQSLEVAWQLRLVLFIELCRLDSGDRRHLQGDLRTARSMRPSRRAWPPRLRAASGRSSSPAVSGAGCTICSCSVARLFPSLASTSAAAIGTPLTSATRSGAPWPEAVEAAATSPMMMTNERGSRAWHSSEHDGI